MRAQASLHRRCRSLLDTLGLEQNLDLEAVRASAATVRGRPVHVREMPEVAPSPTGLWIATDTEDLVLVQAHTTALHTRHIAFHELGHILWQQQHGDQEGDQEQGAGPPLPHLGPPAAQRILGRRHHRDARHSGRRDGGRRDSGRGDSGRRELEAEMLATILTLRTLGTYGARTTVGPPGGAGADRRGPRGSLATVHGWQRGLAEMVAAAAAVHRLRPLWADLRAAHRPGPVLRPGWATLVTPAGWRFRLLRRVIEIRDAQVALRDYAGAPTVAPSFSARHELTQPPHSAGPVDQARWLAHASRAARSGAAPTSAGRTRPLVGGAGLEDEVAALLALAGAWSTVCPLRRRGVARRARAWFDHDQR